MAAKREHGYEKRDAERFSAESHASTRDDFARDRARVLHSAAFRRLAAKTQVLSPANPVDFARNRLTHSLEVAQVGREIADQLGLNPDVVDTACLSHDLGHPPFGHNGERALNDWAAKIGGFEGNAQSLRILTRLEPKVVDADGRHVGLNLTRASLDATSKYPWGSSDSVSDPSGRQKFGVYQDDLLIFEWVRQGAPDRVLCIEAEVMDMSDDIAYSVHDFEDAVTNGYLDPAELNDLRQRESLVEGIRQWVGKGFTHDDLAAALARLSTLPTWLESFDGTWPHLAQLKNLTSDLIGRFAQAATTATREAYPAASLTRFAAHVVVPRDVECEIAVLKGVVGKMVMSHESRKDLYLQQREVLIRLADALWDRGDDALDQVMAVEFRAATDDVARKRVIVDQVASFTDQLALAWHSRLVGEVDGASLGVWFPRAGLPTGVL